MFLRGQLMWSVLLFCSSGFSECLVRQSALLFRLALAAVLASAAALVALRPQSGRQFHQVALRTVLQRARRHLPAAPRPRMPLSFEGLRLLLMKAAPEQPALAGLPLAAERRARALKHQRVAAQVILFLRFPLARGRLLVGRRRLNAQ